ncbi:DUF1236 domain-containing protein [Mangrovicella endophytica]|uniref:DUF1236 domain-containing protein n=1 Tax=Mangrovicella endophytica TaxID=2066697 RepID=UPI000C9E3DAE|nr:DUF1236 domain-containing protein [Mangrovicella endophytica]
MRSLLLAVAAIGLATPAALAQTTTTTVIQETAPTTTTVVEVPAEVRTYVTKQEVPSVTLEGPVVVGKVLPDTVTYQVIPDNDGYAYAVVNGQRVIVDAKTHNVIEVYD